MFVFAFPPPKSCLMVWVFCGGIFVLFFGGFLVKELYKKLFLISIFNSMLSVLFMIFLLCEISWGSLCDLLFDQFWWLVMYTKVYLLLSLHKVWLIALKFNWLGFFLSLLWSFKKQSTFLVFFWEWFLSHPLLLASSLVFSVCRWYWCVIWCIERHKKRMVLSKRQWWWDKSDDTQSVKQWLGSENTLG